MKYFVKMIQTQEEIEDCERFLVNHAQWNCVKQPETWGYMGYLKGRGLLVRMYCREQNPKRCFKNNRERVWKDSAMEVFLAFPDAGAGSDCGRSAPRDLSDDSLYLNFEVNANGALYAQYGYGKKNREFVPERVFGESGCKALVEEEQWMMELLIPEWFLEEVCGFRCDAEFPRMYCNFYKISESPEIEHYLSYQEIKSNTPNFHKPSCFAEAVFRGETI